MKQLPKTYNASKVEDEIYKSWEESGLFNPDNLGGDKPFTIAMPPPNATGILHTGHAVMLAVEDVLTRYHRMKGEKALWLPGTDHASIATQTKVEKLIAKKGEDRHKLGREKFLQEVDKFVDDSRNTIKAQIRKMGSSCDWSRERFTLDEGLSKAVREAFVRMYEDGLIYRGERVVNWCPRCHSTLADDEVEYNDQKSKLYWIKYGPFVLATTRPETKLGDTAVAVNPKDKRYKDMVGKEYDIPGVLGDFKVKVIADHAVDKDFGSGAVKVTPAHSMIDSEMAARHGIKAKQIINEDGKMMDNCGKYAGMTTQEAREAIVKDMKKMDLIDHIDDDYQNKISVCYRCGTAIEPLPSKQWFVAVDKKFKIKDSSKLKWPKDTATLKELSLHVIKSGLIKIVPQRFEKTYFHWMENLHDWCISRQIWYGHQIPVWYEKRKAKSEKQKAEKIYVGRQKPKGDDWIQDDDTLDTWFSSALWTFSTLGWPDNTKDLKFFHPTSVMETGYDILFFWVARMIIMTTYLLNDIPFKTVYLHGLVRDEKGVKMSKSLDNIIDPLDMIKKYGTDALRLSMLIGVTPGNDFKLYDEKIGSYRNFVNKLWNISRFVLGEVKEVKLIENMPQPKTLADQWILEKLSLTVSEVSKNLEQFQISLAGEVLQQFTWNDFADWYVEVAKIEKNKDEILLYVLQNILKLWHPLIPFVTESIWQNFESDNFLMIERWPKVKKIGQLAKDFELIKDIITSIRSLRSENKIEPKKLVNVIMITKKQSLIKEQIEIIKKLARCESVDFSDKKPKGSVGVVIKGIEIYISLEGLVDAKAETERIKKEIKKAEDFISVIKKKLDNKEFIKNAPEAVVKKEQDKLKDQNEKIKKLKQQLDNLK